MPVITGTSGNDSLTSDASSQDTIYGLGGDDTITVDSSNGFDGDDVFPGEGDDLVIAQSPTSVTLEANGGDDTITGGALYSVYVVIESDATEGGWTIDMQAGTASTDQRSLELNDIHRINLRNDTDDYVAIYWSAPSLSTGGGDDTVRGVFMSCIVSLGTGDDLLIVDDIITNLRAGFIMGGDGTNTIDLSPIAGAVQIDVGLNQITRGSNTLTVHDFVEFLGSGFGDTMDATGETQNITFRGEGGADTLTGGHGNDTLDGGFSQDSLDGGDGDDHLTGGYGDDTIIGGDGIDTAYYTGFGGGITVSLVTSGGQYTGAGGTDDLQDIENLVGGDFNDRFVGSTSDNILQLGAGSNTGIGLGGDDTILGGSGVDNIQGGAGEDLLRGYGGRDVLDGGNDDDFLAGGSGNDQLRGGTGSDTLEGGEGRDILIGGPVSGRTFPGDGETDYFVFNDPSESPVGAGRDIIRDFEVGIDQIVLVDMVAGMDFIGTDAFLGPKGGGGGEVRYSHAGSFTIVQADLDSDGTADFEIRLDGTLTLSVNDFLLE